LSPPISKPKMAPVNPYCKANARSSCSMKTAMRPTRLAVTCSAVQQQGGTAGQQQASRQRTQVSAAVTAGVSSLNLPVFASPSWLGQLHLYFTDSKLRDPGYVTEMLHPRRGVQAPVCAVQPGPALWHCVVILYALDVQSAALACLPILRAVDANGWSS
jgi:hypothetical protein